MTTAELYDDFSKRLTAIYEGREAANIADWVFENLTGLKKWERRMRGQEHLSTDKISQLKIYLEELLQHKPVQYVLNEAWFYKMKFFVNADVLIPRPETEELVEWIVRDLRQEKRERLSLIDIGTGSGCIPVALKKELPAATVSAMDLSEKALAVAEQNARQNKVAVNFFRMNFLDESQWTQLSGYDIIVSNPPYIPLKEKGLLDKNVTEFEPAMALFVTDERPYIFYEEIAQFSKDHLNEGGAVYAEVHEAYALPVKTIFEQAGFSVTVQKDIYGKERMVRALRSLI